MENNVSKIMIDTGIMFLNMLSKAIREQDTKTLDAMAQLLDALRAQLEDNEPGAAFNALQKIQIQLFKAR